MIGLKVGDAEPEDRIPIECRRCGKKTASHRDAGKNCGLSFDQLGAYEAGKRAASKQSNMDEFQSMVQAEMAKILGDMNVDRPTSDRDSADRSDSDSSRLRRDASA